MRYKPINVSTIDFWEPEEIIKEADTFGKEYAGRDTQSNKVSTNKLRNLFSTVGKIKTIYKKQKMEKNIDKDKLIRELTLLKPQLAYMRGRNRKNDGVTYFYYLALNAVEKTIKSTKFELAIENFFEFMEAIVAYHRFYGGE